MKIYIPLLLLFPFLAQGQTFDQQFWGTNGKVNSLVKEGNSLYVGGSFDYIGPATGHTAILDPATNDIVSGFPVVNGSVESIIPDGKGGWFIGGAFTKVGAASVTNLAHIYSNNSVSAWNPSPNGDVSCLLLKNGKLFFGGGFTQVSGVSRNFIASVDTSTSVVTSWNPNADLNVYTLSSSRTKIYAGGSFSNIGGQPRNRVAAIDMNTGLATSWNPNVTLGSYGDVKRIFFYGPNIYLGGRFNLVNGQTRNNLAAVDSNTAVPTSWAPVADDYIIDMQLTGSKLYVCGFFQNLNSKAHKWVGAIDVNTGAVFNWNPALVNANGFGNGYASMLFVKGKSVYISGSFNRTGTSRTPYLTVVDTGTAGLLPNHICADKIVTCINSDNTVLYAGGDFTSIGGKGRNNLAELDILTNKVKSWDPYTDDFVRKIIIHNGKAYVCGKFSYVGTIVRHQIAEIDLSSGVATSWNPQTVSSVYALAASGNSVFAVGDFLKMNGIDKKFAAEIEISTGNVTAWDAQFSGGGYVESIAIHNANVYLGGFFFTVAGQNRAGLVAVDQSTGALQSWDPKVGANHLFDIKIAGNRLYAAGLFSSVGSLTRNNVVALDINTGTALSWNPNVNDSVCAILPMGDKVYLAGGFTAVGGTSRNSIARVDTVNGTADSWNPGLNALNSAFSLTNGCLQNVYVGGKFQVNSGSAPSLLSINDPTNVALGPPTSLTITAVGPTTFCNGGNVKLSLTGYSTYQWYDGTTPINNQTNDNYSAAVSGSYSVMVSNSGGCSATSPATTVVVNPLPVKPSITKSGMVLTSSATIGNQWYRNNASISGATSKTYTVTQEGDYSVRVTDGNGCSNESSKLTVTLPTNGIDIHTDEEELNIYPNPFFGETTLEYNLIERILSIEVRDISGKQIKVLNAFDKPDGATHQVRIGNLPAGIYFIHVITEHRSMTSRVISL